jgi:hypothetical protein
MLPTEEQIDEWLLDLFMRNAHFSVHDKIIREMAANCTSNEQFETLVHLFNHLLILNQMQRHDYIETMSKFIQTDIHNGEKLAIVATAWDEQPDSSQFILHALKYYFQRNQKIKFFNSVPSYVKKDNLQKYPRYVLVDEFCGTGRTISQRVKYIVNEAKNRKLDVMGTALVIAGMKKAYETLDSEGISPFFLVTLKAGVTEYFNDPERTRRVDDVKKMEELLAPDIDGTQLPSMGNGEAEALFCFEKSNAPNSNFPIFWWPKDHQGKQRRTIMRRYEL